MHTAVPGSRRHMAMQRDSDKHGPRVDEDLKREIAGMSQGDPVDPRVEEWRETEPPGDDQPESVPGGEAEARSELARCLRPSVFPARRDALVAESRETHAPDRVTDLLTALPGDVEFANVARVWEALGGHRERRDRGGAGELG